MCREQAFILEKYVKKFADFSRICVNTGRTSGTGSWCVRVYDKVSGTMVEIGKCTREKVRALVVFARLGDL